MLSVLINTNLLSAARENGVQRFFFPSSACVYPEHLQRDPQATALKEDDVYPAMPEDGYGWEKLFGERLCRHFHEDYGLEACVARYHNVYGPFGTYDGGREKAPAAICRKIAAARLASAQDIEGMGGEGAGGTPVGDRYRYVGHRARFPTILAHPVRVDGHRESTQVRRVPPRDAVVSAVFGAAPRELLLPVPGCLQVQIQGVRQLP